MTMFDDVPPKTKKTQEFPRILDNLSVGELESYIEELHQEVSRVQADRDKKKASQEAASSVFKF